MVCGTFTVKNVPQDKLEQTMAIWRASTPTPNVTSAKDDGTYTVTAVFPPCPANVKHDPSGSLTPAKG